MKQKSPGAVSGFFPAVRPGRLFSCPDMIRTSVHLVIFVTGVFLLHFPIKNRSNFRLILGGGFGGRFSENFCRTFFRGFQKFFCRENFGKNRLVRDFLNLN